MGSKRQNKLLVPASASGADARFRIVGIGASAGGLEALERFFAHVPTGSGLAFVVVQHLDPTHEGMLPELLQRCTAMPVVQARDRAPVQPNHVYVIPPNRDLSILHGTLHLLEPAAPRGLRLPIDYFLRALAEDQQDLAVGVILSGMGSDGTLGLRAIKEKRGLALAQDPASARFDSMPQSAIAAGLADVVAPAEELPDRIIAQLQRAPTAAITKAEVLDDQTQSALEQAIIVLRTRTRNDFSLYKQSTLHRRIDLRMAIHQIDRIDRYVRYLQENPNEVDLLFKELLIGVTSFFRDPDVWERLRDDVLPALLDQSGPHDTLRAWVPGCSTGEEAYSLAICFKEAVHRRNLAHAPTLQIFATDLGRDAIGTARAGVFRSAIESEVSRERLERYFRKEERGYRVASSIREMVVFAEQNVILDPPFTRLDLLSCRNLLIYLASDVQKKLMSLFHYSLRPGGVLLLGSAESVGGLTGLFEPLDARLKLYRRKAAPGALPVEFPSSFQSAAPLARKEPAMPRSTQSLESLAEQMILQHHSPAAVLVNGRGDILYSSARTGKYLEPTVGKANLNILFMAREGLRIELATAFQQALKQEAAVSVRNVKVGTNGGTQMVNLTVTPLAAPELLRGTVLIVFFDVEAAAPTTSGRGRSSKARDGLIAELQSDVTHLQSELGSAREWMQSSQEELKSANEELQSSNEELQSTNEELTTSKEELQSMNEELQTLNAELQSKLDLLSRANSDMANLLNATEIATVFLDRDLNVRRYTESATRVIKLIPGDVGRPLSDLVTDLDHGDLTRDARDVLRTLVFSERESGTADGRWYRVRVMPYRTLEDVIDGLVLTFIDISVAKKLEEQLRESRGGA